MTGVFPLLFCVSGLLCLLCKSLLVPEWSPSWCNWSNLRLDCARKISKLLRALAFAIDRLLRIFIIDEHRLLRPSRQLRQLKHYSRCRQGGGWLVWSLREALGNKVVKRSLRSDLFLMNVLGAD